MLWFKAIPAKVWSGFAFGIAKAEPIPARVRNGFSLRKAAVVAALVAMGGLAACTSGPVYSNGGPQQAGAASPSQPALLTTMRGRVAVAEPNTRTDQIFRNALLFRLNGAEPVSSPLFEVRYFVSAMDTVTSIESGSGVPAASTYRMQADYTLIRLSDGQTIGAGTRFSTVPYDRNSQLYASQSAVEDARERAGKDLAERVGMALLPVLKREGEPTPVN
ncbi:hypothetical protein FPY71_18110 [Aureimonas fodinaquatilis]|uniref:LPS-assembly lipoprotein n=1 Tax=Aureimonas fodinaquatilis TaxID=2565783 RepID=A0A5B0DP83_9HYPH|nr:LPS assembly lipoprotein LptE [Aureimonas fodinaquatilis]KAA0968238.1 hypothetical protein FPY71_18110 [Aureimonas fodinaquatilis]